MKRLLGLIGLGYRGRNVSVGVEAVRKELQAGKCRCVVVADDASPRAMEKVVRLAAAKGVPIVPGPCAAAIGAQLGRATGHGGRCAGPRVGRRHGAPGARTHLMED